MHHSHESHERSEISRIMQELKDQQKLGATGNFPEGKLDDSDEGEIKIAIGCHDGKVILNFGTPVVWTGFNPQQARQIAESLRKASYQAEGR